MFGHGQVEGFREKYGMEFRKPKWDESVDEGLVRGHEYRIFPLLHRRRLFAEVENFLLYDFFTPAGYVNEDVFAYSNGWGNGYGAEKRMEARGLVIYHNKYAATSGWIKTSVAFMDKDSGKLVQRKPSARGWPCRTRVMLSSRITSAGWSISARAVNCGRREFMPIWARISARCSWIGAL